jgi:hypothetical protein
MTEMIPTVPSENENLGSGEWDILPTLTTSMNRIFGHLLRAKYNGEVLTIEIGRVVAQFSKDGQLLGGHSIPRSSQ